jgi:glycerol kinase
MTGVLVVDVGTSGVRSAVVLPDGRVTAVRRVPVLPSVPFPGLVELDAAAIAAAVLLTANAALEEAGPVDAVGIAAQRASTIVWDRATGEPIGPGLGWQDLRTVGECLVHQGSGLRLMPNQSATKLAALLQGHDPETLCFGTVDSWVAWTLSDGGLHVTDLGNAGVTGLVETDGSGWDHHVLEVLGIPASVLPTIVDSSGRLGEAKALPGAPMLAGIAGDQQASLLGQSCVRPGDAKATFGTGAMLDVLTERRPGYELRGEQGTFPIVAWRLDDTITWGAEGVALAAGACIEWLRDDLGLLRDASESDAVADSVPDSGGVVFVPALLGLGTPHWDFGATGTLLGLTKGTGRAHIVRAVLEGIAHRGADLLAAAEADAGVTVAALRVDGGMSANNTFVQALADATQRPVEISPELEATTLGAGYLAGLATGFWTLDEIGERWEPALVVEPASTPDRGRWAEAVRRAGAWTPDLSALEF